MHLFSGDTWKFTVTGSTVAWTALLDSGPSARYGFVSGVVDGYWIISHGNILCAEY